MTANYFPTAEAMSAHQADRELREALRVQSMSPDELLAWLEENWGRMQAGASQLYGDLPPQPATVRYFASFDEKNRFDEECELQQALLLQSRMAP